MAYPSHLGSLLLRAALLGAVVVGAEVAVVSLTPGCVSGTTPTCDGSPEAAAACSPKLDGTDYDGALDAHDSGHPITHEGGSHETGTHPSDASDATTGVGDAPTSDAPTTPPVDTGVDSGTDAGVDAPAPSADAGDAGDAGIIADAATDGAG